jgi:hypothetical protein
MVKAHSLFRLIRFFESSPLLTLTRDQSFTLPIHPCAIVELLSVLVILTSLVQLVFVCSTSRVASIFYILALACLNPQAHLQRCVTEFYWSIRASHQTTAFVTRNGTKSQVPASSPLTTYQHVLLLVGSLAFLKPSEYSGQQG